MSVEDLQVWIGVVGGLVTAGAGTIRYFTYLSKRDRLAAVGASFASTVDDLASDNETRRMVGAVLLRRFFNSRTEQGAAGTAYFKETIEVIAGLLREPQPPRLQKTLADGLRLAWDLRQADLQKCDLRNAYLGKKEGDRVPVDLSRADLFEAKLNGASLRGVNAAGAVFYLACCEGTVFIDSNLEGCDFREATLKGAKFAGARIGGARFAGATDLPPGVAKLLDADFVARPGSVVRTGES